MKEKRTKQYTGHNGSTRSPPPPRRPATQLGALKGNNLKNLGTKAENEKKL
jgi:hypothetical protein